MVDERSNERVPGVEVERGPIAQHDEHLGRAIEIEAGEVAIVVGRQDHDLVGTGGVARPVGTHDRIEIGDDAHSPTGGVGCAGPGAERLRRCLILVALAEGTSVMARRTGLGQGGVGSGRAVRGDDDPPVENGVEPIVRHGGHRTRR